MERWRDVLFSMLISFRQEKGSTLPFKNAKFKSSSQISTLHAIINDHFESLCILIYLVKIILPVHFKIAWAVGRRPRYLTKI